MSSISDTVSSHSDDGFLGIKVRFPTDDPNADLEGYWLECCVPFEQFGFDFGFTSIPEGFELSFIIDVKIYHQSGKTSMNLRWKVAKLRNGGCVSLKCRGSPGAVANWKDWQVKFYDVKRRPGTSMAPESSLVWQHRVKIQPQSDVDRIKTEVADAVEEDCPTTPPVASSSGAPKKRSNKPQTSVAPVPTRNVPSATSNLNATQKPKKAKFHPLFNRTTTAANFLLSDRFQSEHDYAKEHNEVPIEFQMSAESHVNSTQTSTQTTTETKESSPIQCGSNKFAKPQVSPNVVNKRKNFNPMKTTADVSVTVSPGKHTSANSNATQPNKVSNRQAPTRDVANNNKKSDDSAPEPINVQSASAAVDNQTGSDPQAQLVSTGRTFLHDMTCAFTELLKSSQDDTAIEQVYNFANVYDLQPLKQSCEEKLIGQISFGSVCNSLKMAKSYGGDRLLAENLKFIRDNRGNPLLPWAQLMNSTDANGNFLLDIMPTATEKTSLKRKRTETESA